MKDFSEMSIDELRALDIGAVVAESRRRGGERGHGADAETGRGCSGERQKTLIPAMGVLWLPVSMVNDARFSPDMDEDALVRLRFEHDFEFWCHRCVVIQDKMGCGAISFDLNGGQRKVVERLEAMRRADMPLRMIVLKARQWGCSTLIETYMQWIQIVHKRYWNSLVCAQNRDTATVMKRHYEMTLQHYPDEYWDEAERRGLKSVGGSRSLYNVNGRDCTMLLASARTVNAARGNDIAMAHLSEVAFWSERGTNGAGEVIRSICASVALLPMTMVVLESTANGTGGYFNREWVSACAGKSDKEPVFVAWFEIEYHVLPVGNAKALWESLDDYELRIWNEHRLTLEQINWYHHRRMEYENPKAMMAEYPSDAAEAFSATETSVFDEGALKELRERCCRPIAIGELVGAEPKGPESLEKIHFEARDDGQLFLWQYPDTTVELKNRYIVAVDIGGRSDASDFSVIAVFDRLNPARPELVAQWRGHVDHDILAWMAARVARWYADALLIIESNTLESDRTEGDHGEFILHELERHYRNLYRRPDGKPGFHTNRATKTLIVNNLIGMVRDRAYIERDVMAIDEALAYERKPRGAFGAKDGMHDDILITRAMALAYCAEAYMADIRRKRVAASIEACVHDKPPN